MNRTPLRRRFAAWLMRLAEWLLPERRASWGQAMRAEFEHLDGDGRAVAWAFGCCLSSLRLRLGEAIMKRDRATSFAVAFVFGAAIWAISPYVTGTVEPWDAGSPYYLAALFGAGLVVGWICPKSFWPVLPGVAIGQFAYILMFLPKGPLIGVGLVLLFVFGSVAAGAAFIGGRLRRIVARDDLSTG